jgi:hypothetical protein
MDHFERPDDLAGVTQDLDAYARGTAHAMPTDLLPRVLAAVASEAPPTPQMTFARAIAALAPRDAARAFGAMLALVGGQRRGGVGLRLRAAALVAATVVVLGSAAAGATVGGVRLAGDLLGIQPGPSTTATDLMSPTPVRSLHPATPTPDDRSPHPSARPTPSEEPQESAEPSGPAESAEPSDAADDPSGDPSDDGAGGSGDGAHSPEPSDD